MYAYFWDQARGELTGLVPPNNVITAPLNTPPCGQVYFGSDAESHRGLCHGGAMTSVLDDVCGHVCFVTGNGPWDGATVEAEMHP